MALLSPELLLSRDISQPSTATPSALAPAVIFFGLRGRNGHRHRGSTYGSQRTRSAMPLRVRKAFGVYSKLAQVSGPYLRAI